MAVGPSLRDSASALQRLQPAHANPRTSAAIILLVAAAALAAGILFRPDVVAPIVRGDLVHLGGAPLESAFTLLAFVSSVVVFRAWSRMFPTPVPTINALYPLRGTTIAARDFLLTLRDSAVACGAVALWIAPSLLVPGGRIAGWSLLYIGVAMLLVACAAYSGLVLYVRVALRATEGEAAETASRLAASGAPGLAFGLVLLLLLALKLGVGELLTSLQATAGSELTGWARISVAARYALIAPIAIAIGAVVFAGAARARHGLRDMVHVAAATVVIPELSYDWVDATKTVGATDSHAVLLAKRDRVRIQRAAPFRVIIATGLAIVAATMVLWGNDLVVWLGLGLNAAWILLWLRVPDVVRRADTVALNAWDRLLVTATTLRDARRLTMAYAAAPYLGILLLPSAVAVLVHRDVYTLVFTLLSAAALIAHAAIQTARGTHG